jgi:branched-chain amino acid transport system permease protein
MISLLWQGTVTGLLYAIAAMGLVMIFKSSKMVNFAHGAIAGLSAFVVYVATTGSLSWPWLAGVALALAVAIGVASFAYLAIAPMLNDSDSLKDNATTATIATLGFGLMMEGIILWAFGSNIVSLDLPLPTWSTNLGGVRLSSYDIAVLIVTAIVVGALFWLIDRTRLGIAFRAVSTRPFAAAVCGLSVRKVHLFSWVASAILGVVAALLIVPTTFLSSTTVATFMLQAFAAAVIGGFESLPGAVVGGILVGIASNLFTFYVAPEFINSFLLALILLSLSFFPGGILSKTVGARV